ncbi:50S ribosomal protein L13 [Patescibacteria group bacterium]|nr:50S ribosomal protein L13 [Patescibacteria group bacterium]
MRFTNKTFMANKENVTPNWHLIDAKNRVLGEVATDIAKKLIGKEKPDYTPHINTGDKVVVINAAHISVSNDKMDSKVYYWHTGYPGGIKQIKLGELLKKDPTAPVRKAVKRMLPQNKLLKQRMVNLYIYADEAHNHSAQLSHLEKLGKEPK